MKIGLLHHSVPPIVGGVESVIAHHARLFCDAGHQVHAIAGRGARFDERIFFHQVPLIDSIHPEILACKNSLDQGSVPPAFETLVDTIQNELLPIIQDLDILIAHNVCSLAKNLPLTAALNRIASGNQKLRLILWHHDLAWTTPRYRSELHDGYPWDLLRTDWEEVTQVVVSRLRRDELSQLLNIPEERIHIVPNGVNINKFLKFENTTTHLIEKLQLDRGEPLLLLPVRITRRKNLEQALAITAALQDHFKNPVLLISGPIGPHNPANKQYLEELKEIRKKLNLDHAVHFLADVINDYLPDEIISDLYHIADALLLPSREEGFGIPVLEAGLVRMPVFCSHIAPLKELGMHQATYFSPDDKPKIVAEKISHVLNASSSYHLQQRVRHEYTWESIYSNQIKPLLEK